jgi:hypothetical protein
MTKVIPRNIFHHPIMYCNMFSFFSATVFKVEDVSFMIVASSDYNLNSCFAFCM